MANYPNLIVWQKSHNLALRVYKIDEKFPRHEMFGLTSQLKRAVLSIPTNIVEGYARKSSKELMRFIDIALSSLAETEYLIEFATALEYIEKEDRDTLALITEVEKLLWGLKKSKKESL